LRALLLLMMCLQSLFPAFAANRATRIECKGNIIIRSYNRLQTSSSY